MIRNSNSVKRILALTTTASILMSVGSVSALAADEDSIETGMPTVNENISQGASASDGEKSSTQEIPVAGEETSGSEGISVSDGEKTDPKEMTEAHDEEAAAGNNWKDGLDSDADETYVYELSEYGVETGISIGLNSSNGLNQQSGVQISNGSQANSFILKDNDDNDYYGFCAEENNPALVGIGMKYARRNLEDALTRNSNEWTEYIGDDQASNVRAILEDLYGSDDKEITETLSKKLGNVAGLTKEEAITATQWAIWANVNADNKKYISNSENAVIVGADEDSTKRIQMIYQYLMSLDGVTSEYGKDTIIMTSEKLADSNVTAALAKEVEENIAENLDTEELAKMEAGEKAVQTSGSDTYLITKNDDGTYTVEVTFNLEQFGDLEGMNLEVRNNGTSILETGLDVSHSSEDGSTGWTIDTHGMGTLQAKLRDSINKLSMKVTGEQKTSPGCYFYQSECLKSGDSYGSTSQNMVGWSDKETEVINASLTFTIELPEVPVIPSEPGVPVTPDRPSRPDRPVRPVDPAEPSDSEEPVDTEIPEEPADSEYTVDSTDPAETEEPVDTTDSTETEEPADSVTPAEPGESSDSNTEVADKAEPMQGTTTNVNQKEEVTVNKAPAAVKQKQGTDSDKNASLSLLPQTGAVASQSSLYTVFLSVSGVMAAAAAAVWVTMNRKETE